MSAHKTKNAAFNEAWAEKEAEGYQYGADALEQVRFGWDIASAKHLPRIATLEAEVRRLTAERDEARAALSEAKAALSDVSGALVDAGMAIGLATGFGESVRILAGQRDKLQRDFDYQSKECDDLKNQINAMIDLLSALDSGGGEGKTNSPKNWESSK